MSGHSKWSQIKHKKGATDAKKSKVFSQLANQITLATKQGKSGDPKINPYLRDAISKYEIKIEAGSSSFDSEESRRNDALAKRNIGLQAKQ